MRYEKIIEGNFISRPNRFVAKVEIDGEKQTAHVKNTGRCRELLVPGCTVYLEDHEGRMGSRKYRYSLIAVRKETAAGPLYINMDSQAPNKVAAEALKDGRINIPGMSKLTVIKPESTFGNSRFDFYIEDRDGRKGFIEVKGCTLENEGIASFPDAPTERGVKHIEELILAKEQGYTATLLFIVQMKGMKYIRPNDETHPAFGNALRKASETGVNVIAYECEVKPDELSVSGNLPVKL